MARRDMSISQRALDLIFDQTLALYPPGQKLAVWTTQALSTRYVFVGIIHHDIFSIVAIDKTEFDYVKLGTILGFFAPSAATESEPDPAKTPGRVYELAVAEQQRLRRAA